MKKEKSVEQLNIEGEKVSLGGDHDHKACRLEREATTACHYRSLFVPQRKLCLVKDRDNPDNLAAGSRPIGHLEDVSFGRVLMEIKPSLEEAPYESNETGTERRKVADARETASTFQLKLEGSAQSAVSKDAHGLDKGNDCLSPKDSFSDEQRSLHKYLSAEMEKLCEVLQLPMIKQTVEAFLDYVMKNHHVNQDSVPILQAFQISLCWNAASILKKEIDKGDSLRLAKKVLNFQCTEEAAHSFYLKLLSLKKGFLQLSRNNSGSPPKNLVSASEGCGKKLPLAGNPLSGSFDLQNVKLEAGERSSSVEVLEEQAIDELGGDFVDKKIKKLQKKCDKYMYLLRQKHEKEILELCEMKEKHKLQLEGEVRLESAVIHLTYPEKLRVDMLKSVDNEFKKKLQERENLMEADLKELQARHSAELEEKRKSIDDWMDRIMSCISSSGPGKEVPTATSDTGVENIDRIVQDDCGAGIVIPSVMLETAADDPVAGDVCSETSFRSPANPVTDKVLVVEQESAVSFTSVEIPPGVPSTGGSEIGTASTLELNTSLAVERGDNKGNLVAADVQGDQVDQTRSGPREVASSPPLAAAERSSPTISFPELPQEHLLFKTVESSLERLDQARSRNGETVRPPLSIEAMLELEARILEIETQLLNPTSEAGVKEPGSPQKVPKCDGKGVASEEVLKTPSKIAQLQQSYASFKAEIHQLLEQKDEKQWDRQNPYVSDPVEDIVRRTKLEIKTIEESFYLALRVEKSLKVLQPFTRMNNEARETSNRKFTAPGRFTKPAVAAEPRNKVPLLKEKDQKDECFKCGIKGQKDECFKCGIKGHMAYECPTKRNLFIGDPMDEEYEEPEYNDDKRS
ncbi:OLC1v1005491C1 [Oldenlandia corymbosa var. corymbosa]|uniref:OLC1v1005491C1 n=1 Tax=Oldenlandia corymbosa var. corymbosa TaxID=529605 RepID=A0AAV1DFE7_OLDCO|nr:OLC1v1005491C1 [Oldenlandia corymbosa var. corymbosa]